MSGLFYNSPVRIAAQPTRSLPWYDVYNKTKHDRSSHFAEATLLNCLRAVSANLALFSVRFGPFHLFHGGGTLAAFFNQLFSIELKDCSPSSFYAPKITIPVNQRSDLICYGSQDFVEPRIVDPLKLLEGQSLGPPRSVSQHVTLDGSAFDHFVGVAEQRRWLARLVIIAP